MGTTPQWELEYSKRQAQINAHARNCYHPRLRVVDKILLYHPDEYRRYLQQHPCRGCVGESFCDEPCEAYLHWYNARLEVARARWKG